jgi:hypothetical protein
MVIMTHLADSVEKMYQKFTEEVTLSRKKTVLGLTIVGTVAGLAACSLPKLYPEVSPIFEH